MDRNKQKWAYESNKTFHGCRLNDKEPSCQLSTKQYWAHGNIIDIDNV